MSEPRIWPADVYDAFELSAYAYGIGRILITEAAAEGMVPCCIMGHAEWIAGDHYGGIVDLLGRYRPRTHENDNAVRRINMRKGAPLMARVTWPEYTAEFNVVRGD